MRPNTTTRDQQDGTSVEQGVLVRDNAHLVIRDMTINNNADDSQRSPTLRDALLFQNMALREHSIVDAHHETCKWLLETSQYLAWVAGTSAEEHHRLLWIKGHAGAGKSTIMKFAVEQARRAQEALIVPHFFNARGTTLEKSAEGMYRTLIVLLLEELSDEAVRKLNAAYRGRHPGSGNWPAPELERMLKRVVEGLDGRSIVFYVDALDECRTQDVRRMLRVFRELVGSSGQVRVCFASRPYPNITFHEALFINVSKEIGHRRDIVRYIHDHLNIGNSKLSIEVRQEVYRKAGGIFMWVTLVVDILNQEHDDGNMSKLTQRLAEIPAGLHELFRHTLDRYPESREPLLVCFQWKLFELDDLSVEQLWWGTQLALGRGEADVAQEYRMLSQSDMARYIVNISRGLIKLDQDHPSRRHPDGRRIQLLHESVRDFVFEENGPQDLHGTRRREEFEAQSHEKLRDWCLTELKWRRPQLLHAIARENADKAHPDSSSLGWSVQGDLPLAAYATHQLLRHAEHAQKHGRDQTAFLYQYDKESRSHVLSCRHHDYPTDVFTIQYGLVEVLIGLGCAQLIRKTQLEPVRQARRNGEAVGLRAQHGTLGPALCCTPIVEALRCGHIHTIEALLDVYLQVEPRHPDLQQVLEELGQSWETRSDWNWYGPVLPERPLLAIAYESPRLAIFFLVALAPPASLEQHSSTLRDLASLHDMGNPDTELCISRFRRFLEVMRFFIEEGLTSDAIDFGDPYLLLWYRVCDSYLYHHDVVAQNVVADTVALLVRSRV